MSEVKQIKLVPGWEVIKVNFDPYRSLGQKYSGGLRRAPNVLFVIWKYAKVSLEFADNSLQFTETEWVPCEGFLALLAVLWPLVCTV